MSLNQPAQNIMAVNEVDNFLNDLDKEAPADPFKSDSKDPFAKEEVKEEKKEEVGAKEEKPLPFHKDPKVQRYIQKEVEKITANLKPNASVGEISAAKDEMEEVLIRVIGNDTPEKVSAVKDMKKVLMSLADKGAQNALSTIKEEQAQAKKLETESQEELMRGLEAIEETHGIDITSGSPVAKKMRSDFMDFVRRVSPKDKDGEITSFPDLEETFAIFQEQTKRPAPSRAKEAVSRSMQRGSEAAPADIKDNSWRAVDKAFSKIN